MSSVRPKTVSRTINLSRSLSKDRSSSRTRSNTPVSTSTSRILPSPRGRLASTPTHGEMKKPDFSLNESEINSLPLTDSSCGQEKTKAKAPKLLKPLGLQRSIGKNERPAVKTTASREAVKPLPKKVIVQKPQESDLRASYLIYQQLVYMNHIMSGKKNNVLKEGENELLQLWALAKDAKTAADEMEAREQLVQRYIAVNEAYNRLEPVVKDISATLRQLKPSYRELSEALDCTRHQLPLKNAVHVTPSEIEELTELFQNANSIVLNGKIPHCLDYEDAALSTEKFSQQVNNSLKFLHKCNCLTTQGIGSLGEQLLSDLDDSIKPLKLNEIEI